MNTALLSNSNVSTATAEAYDAALRERLIERLTYLTTHIPKSIHSASVQATREWVKTQKAAAKTLSLKKSTNTDLQSAINSMESYE